MTAAKLLHRSFHCDFVEALASESGFVQCGAAVYGSTLGRAGPHQRQFSMLGIRARGRNPVLPGTPKAYSTTPE